MWAFLFFAPWDTGGTFLKNNPPQLHSIWAIHSGHNSSPDVPVSAKPVEVRMGKGKGSTDYWAAKVKPGRIMFEIDGVSEVIAREALRLGAMKLPVTTRVVVREDW